MGSVLSEESALVPLQVSQTESSSGTTQLMRPKQNNLLSNSAASGRERERERSCRVAEGIAVFVLVSAEQCHVNHSV